MAGTRVYDTHCCSSADWAGTWRILLDWFYHRDKSGAKEKAASAIAIMFGGLTVALVTGVPLGTFIGQHFGWRETFLAVSMLGVIALISSQLLIPANIPGRAAASIRDR